MLNMIKYFLMIIILATKLLGQSNISLIEQEGDMNSVDVSQIGYKNVSIIHQSGNVNNNYTIQDGNDNYFFYRDLGATNPSELNAAQLSMFGLNNYNNDNVNCINQNGNYNEVIITNSGAQNTIDIIQNGDNNYIYTRNIGENNIYNILQEGNMNQISEQVNASNTEFDLTQIGNHNRIIHRDTTLLGIDLDIVQTGNWIQTTIINGYAE